MSPRLGWLLAAAAFAAGGLAYGWRGLLLALTLVVFWLLLQFNRSVRVMRAAAGRPLGRIDNAVMLHARLRPGMNLMQILPLTRSLGEKVDDKPETFVWRDGGGDAVRVELRGGRVSQWRLERAGNTGGWP